MLHITILTTLASIFYGCAGAFVAQYCCAVCIFIRRDTHLHTGLEGHKLINVDLWHSSRPASLPMVIFGTILLILWHGTHNYPRLSPGRTYLGI